MCLLAARTQYDGGFCCYLLCRNYHPKEADDETISDQQRGQREKWGHRRSLFSITISLVRPILK